MSVDRYGPAWLLQGTGSQVVTPERKQTVSVVRRIVVVTLAVAALACAFLCAWSRNPVTLWDSQYAARSWGTGFVHKGTVYIVRMTYLHRDVSVFNKVLPSIREDAQSRGAAYFSIEPSDRRGWYFRSAYDWCVGPLFIMTVKWPPYVTCVAAGFPLWPLPFALAVYPALVLLRGPVSRYRRRRQGRCVRCGYNLTGNRSGVCPECGTRLPSGDTEVVR